MRCTWLLLLVGCGSEEEERTAPSNVGCNGSVENCELRVDEVRFLKTHNSHASLDRGYHEWAANHVEAIPTQLADGVRSLNVDVYEGDEGLITCHGLCELGSQPLVEVFAEIETFLTSNPTQVVLLDFQDEVGDGRIAAALADHGLSRFARTVPSALEWPTLGEMADAGETLIVLGSRSGTEPAWFHENGEYAYRTGWSYQTPEQLDCEPADPVVEGGLYEIVHVLTNPIASPESADTINHEPVIGEHLERCAEEVGFVHQISVDYYRIGDALDYGAGPTASAD